jgi:hypothetical protein
MIIFWADPGPLVRFVVVGPDRIDGDTLDSSVEIEFRGRFLVSFIHHRKDRFPSRLANPSTYVNRDLWSGRPDEVFLAGARTRSGTICLWKLLP